MTKTNEPVEQGSKEAAKRQLAETEVKPDSELKKDQKVIESMQQVKEIEY